MPGSAAYVAAKTFVLHHGQMSSVAGRCCSNRWHSDKNRTALSAVRCQCKLISLLYISGDVRKPNFGSVLVFKNWNRTKTKRSNPKFRFPWIFSKPNLSHTNSQYLSHSHKALTFFTLRTLSESKWSWNLGLENRGPKCKMHTQERQFTRFFLNFTTDLQRRPNRTDGFSNRTKPTVFLKTEPNLKIHSAHLYIFLPRFSSFTYLFLFLCWFVCAVILVARLISKSVNSVSYAAPWWSG